MELGDLDGAAAGAFGGLVKWHQGPHELTAWERVTAAGTSCVCGFGFGYLCQAVIEWQWPNVPHTVAVGLSFVAGLASGVLSQGAVGLAWELVTRLKARIVDRIAPTRPPDGTTTAARPDQPKA